MRCEAFNEDEADVLLPQLHTPHFDEVLRDLRHPLLAFVDREVRPVDELSVDLHKRSGSRLVTYPH